MLNQQLFWRGEMIRCGNQIRLHQDDIDRLFKLTGSIPTGIRSVEDWNRFINQYLFNHDEGTPESQLIGMLLVDEKLNPA